GMAGFKLRFFSNFFLLFDLALCAVIWNRQRSAVIVKARECIGAVVIVPVIAVAVVVLNFKRKSAKRQCWPRLPLHGVAKSNILGLAVRVIRIRPALECAGHVD